MGKNHFTEEQVQELRKNPYVVSVTDRYINYSEEFKELFLIDYENGSTPSAIFSKYGFDPKVLGEQRRYNFVQRIKKESRQSEGFKDTRKDNSWSSQNKRFNTGRKNRTIETQNQHS